MVSTPLEFSSVLRSGTFEDAGLRTILCMAGINARDVQIRIVMAVRRMVKCNQVVLPVHVYFRAGAGFPPPVLKPYQLNIRTHDTFACMFTRMPMRARVTRVLFYFLISSMLSIHTLCIHPSVAAFPTRDTRASIQ